MDTIPVGQAVLRKIVSKVGKEVAASQLGLTERALTSFLNGAVAVPDRLLLRAVDIVLEELQDRLAPSQPFHNPIQP